MGILILTFSSYTTHASLLWLLPDYELIDSATAGIISVEYGTAMKLRCGHRHGCRRTKTKDREREMRRNRGEEKKKKSE